MFKSIFLLFLLIVDFFLFVVGILGIECQSDKPFIFTEIGSSRCNLVVLCVSVFWKSTDDTDI